MFDKATVVTNHAPPSQPLLKHLKRNQWAQLLDGGQQIVYRPNQWLSYRGGGDDDRAFALIVGDNTLMTFHGSGERPIRLLAPGEVLTVTIGRNCGEPDRLGGDDE